MTKVAGVAIPDSPDGLRELLEDDAQRKEIFNSAETTKEFLAGYAKVMNKGENLSKQISEQVAATITDTLKDHGVAGRPDQSAFQTDAKSGLPNVMAKNRPWVSSVRNAAYNPALPTAALDGLYGGLGDLALDVHRYRSGRDVAAPEAFKKVMDVTNAYSETDPSTGGFLVPEELRSTIMQIGLESSIVRQRATVINMGSLTTSIPYIDQTTHVGSVYGGMIFYWVSESASITSTEARFGRVKLEANKLVGGARVPNELWADAPALSSWLEVAAPSGLAFYEDHAFINGSGVGEPLGIRNATAKVQFDRTTVDQLVPGDVFGMYARMLPQSLGNAVWLVNQTLLPEVFSLALDVGTGGAPVNVLDITAGPQLSLLGRPLIVTEKLPALASNNGDDLMFVDFAYYLLGDRQGISVDYSEHSRFMNDETELRIIERVDGRPWVQSALTPLNGDTLSPYVGLTDS